MSAATGDWDPADGVDLRAAVDVWDATARLEAAGHGDLAAQRLGFDTVFAQAAAQFQPAEPPASGAQSRWSLQPALWRGTFIIAGVLLCLAASPAGAQPMLLFVAGAAGWFSVQVVSTILWWGKGSGQVGQACRLARRAAALLLAAALVAAVVSGRAELVLWPLWGASAAVALCLAPGWRIALAGGAAAGLAWLGHLKEVPVAAPFLGVVLILVWFWWSWRQARVPVTSSVRLRRGLGAEMASALVRLAAQLATIAIVWMQWPDVFVVIAVSTLVAAAFGEVALDLVGLAARGAAGRCTRWGTACLLSGLVGAAGVALVGLVSVGTLLIAARLAGLEVPPLAMVTVGLIASIGAAASSSLRLGSSGAATLIALAGLILVGVVLSAGTFEGPVHWSLPAALASTAVVVAFASTRLANPKAW